MTYVKKNQDTSPIATNLLYPDIPKGVPDKIQQKHQKAKSYHVRNVKVLPDHDISQKVHTHVAPIHRGSYWKTGTCLQKLSDRSYLVETDGEVFQQNRQAKEAPTLLDETNKLLKEDAVHPAPTLQPTCSAAAIAGPVVNPPARRLSSQTIKRPPRFQDRVQNCTFLVANATKYWELATRISQLVACWWLILRCWCTPVYVFANNLLTFCSGNVLEIKVKVNFLLIYTTNICDQHESNVANPPCCFS